VIEHASENSAIPEGKKKDGAVTARGFDGARPVTLTETFSVMPALQAQIKIKGKYL
jgi:hypothetical protein